MRHNERLISWIATILTAGKYCTCYWPYNFFACCL